MGRLVVGLLDRFLRKNRGESINFEPTGSDPPKTRDRRRKSWSVVRQQGAKRPHVPLLHGSGESKLSGLSLHRVIRMWALIIPQDHPFLL